MLFLTFSVLVAIPKNTYRVANPARGLLNREKGTNEKKSEKVWQRIPRLNPHLGL